jgi:hypothetical protein
LDFKSRLKTLCLPGLCGAFAGTGLDSGMLLNTLSGNTQYREKEKGLNGQDFRLANLRTFATDRTITLPLSTLSHLGAEAAMGVAMNQTPNELWLAFEALAKTYPHDDGVRITADLARWLIAERQRVNIPVPPVLQKVVQSVTEEVLSADGHLVQDPRSVG